MLYSTAGSKASALQRRVSLTLTVLCIPIALSACVSGQQQNFATLAATAAKEEVAADAAKAAEAETSEASTVTALAPVRNENGTISGSSAIDRMIVQAADANNIPRDLAFGVVHVESTYNPRARGRGVYGLSQIMPSTARSLGFAGSSEDLLEPATNLRYGMRYLAGAWEKGGRDVCRASMKYKGGHRATTMTRSAASYCSRVRQQMQRIAGNPALAGAPVALAANAPATAAAVQVAAAPQAAPATRVASAVPVPASAANALTSSAGTSNAAAAIEASRSQVAAIAHPAAPTPSPIAAAVAAASSPASSEPSLSLADEAVSAAAPAASDLGEPDPSRFGG